jgi:hypothetical protein
MSLSREKQLDILNNAAIKVKTYNEPKDANRRKRGRRYNFAYHEILQHQPLVDESGRVGTDSLNLIVKGLKQFDMNRQMDRLFGQRLEGKLGDGDTPRIITELRRARIDKADLWQLKDRVEALYQRLAEAGDRGLAILGKRFDVGATKIMNFLLPEFSVIVDHNVADALNKTSLHQFERYWWVMASCRRELDAWRELNGDLSSLLEVDENPTTLTRIFDKCAFVVGAGWV